MAGEAPYELEGGGTEDKSGGGGTEQPKKKTKAKTYTEDEVDEIANKRSREAALYALRESKRKEKEEDDSDNSSSMNVINPKVVKQLKDTVSIFQALKDLSSNPLQKIIEEQVGGMAASVVQKAFSPQHPEQKKDLLAMVLDSQFGYGLGTGLGQRGPELVETAGKWFGKDNSQLLVDGILGKYGDGKTRGIGGSSGGSNVGIGGSTSGGIGGGNPGGTGGSTTGSEQGRSQGSPQQQKATSQSDKELLLSLDPNNAEHIAAYAEHQGGLPIDVARKMLMIHQDAFIKQLKEENAEMQNAIKQKETVHIGINDAGENAGENVISYKKRKKEEIKEVKNENEEVEKIVEVPDRWDDKDLAKEIVKEKVIKDEDVEFVDESPVKESIESPIIELPVEPESIKEQEEQDETKIELVEEEDIKEPEEKRIVTAKREEKEKSDVKMCLKCKKIKPVHDTALGKLCDDCKKKYIKEDAEEA